MKRTKYLSLPIIIAAMVLGTIGLVSASAPVLPSSFYGEIEINDNPPSAGDNVNAYISGVSGIAASAAIKSESSDLVYSLNVPGDDPETTADKEGGVPGDIVTFKIGSRVVATGSWSEGSNEKLDFHPPEALPGGPYSGEVNSAISLNGAADDEGGDAETYEWDLDNDGEYDDASGQNPSHTWTSTGVKTIGLKVTDEQGGEGTASTTVTVNAIAAQITLDAATLSQTYDGSAKVVTATTNPSGLSYSITYDGAGTAPANAGSYAVVATITAVNYSGSDSGTLVIAKASSTTTVTGGTFTYDGNPHAASVSVTGAGGLNLAPDAIYSCGSAPVDVADTPCTASYSYAGDTNHTGSSDSDTITITPAAATIALSGLTHTYDGTAKSATVTTTPGGLSHSVTYDGSSTPPANAGSYAVVASITNPNYSGEDANGTLVINRAEPDIVISNTSQVYDGSAKTVTVMVTPALSYAVTYDGSTSAPTDAGIYDVVVTVDTSNYYSVKNGTLTITKAEPAITITDLEQVYDGNPKPVSVTVTPSLSYNVTYNGSATVPSAPGSYTVVVTVDTANYYGTKTETLVILARHSVALVNGWNLVSFAVEPESTDIEEVLESIDGHFDLVYAWDASGAHSGAGNWMKYVPGAGYGNTLTTLDDKTGFWIHMTAADTLEVTGALPVSTDISILIGAGGWNLVGYPSNDSGALPAILSSLGTDYSLVYAYHPSDSSDPWKLYDRDGAAYANDLAALDPGWGYWIKASAAHTWSVPY
ncbi:MAG: hypothetical protein HPY72_13235 [Anaerolineae bacterium]|nr:hypothetical protein [Anaerolineae bacterium]